MALTCATATVQARALIGVASAQRYKGSLDLSKDAVIRAYEDLIAYNRSAAHKENLHDPHVRAHALLRLALPYQLLNRHSGQFTLATRASTCFRGLGHGECIHYIERLHQRLTSYVSCRSGCCTGGVPHSASRSHCCSWTLPAAERKNTNSPPTSGAPPCR